MNRIYLRRAGKMIVEPKTGTKKQSSKGKTNDNTSRAIATIQKNIESLGYVLSGEITSVLETYSIMELGTFYKNLVRNLSSLKGANHTFEPMYPGFPNQVMKMSEVRLYLNALYHYLTLKMPPDSQNTDEERPPLTGDDELIHKKLLVIGRGSIDEFKGILTTILASSVAFSPTDQDDVKWFVNQFSSEIDSLLPESFLNKENLSFTTAQVMSLTPFGDRMVEFFDTPTDVLRLAVAFSGGDISLKEPCRFQSFSRRYRRVFLSVIESFGTAQRIAEELFRWKNRWIRLAERLHPGDFTKVFPESYKAFTMLWNNARPRTFNAKVESLILQGNVRQLVELLSTRPGEYARRLDHLLRLERSAESCLAPGKRKCSENGPTDSQRYADDRGIVAGFAAVAKDVSTSVLLQVLNHFRHRESSDALRVFFPKGAVGNLFAVEKPLPPIPMDATVALAKMCEETLIKRFEKLPSLGKCYLDHDLIRFNAPFAMRSAAKALRTIVRGSRLPVPRCKALRMFIWWKNGKSRVDLDLSAAMYDKDANFIDFVSYERLKAFGAVHRGDITDAPKGAAEFIDVDVKLCLENKVRYIVTSLNSYTEQPYCDLPECFTGWMAREKPGSGEVFEPKTVVDKIDVTADTRCCIPAVFDIVNNEMIWADIALTTNPRFANNVTNNLSGVSLMLRAMLNLKKTTLYDLFSLHIAGRGKMVGTKAEADTVFSVEEGITPWDIEQITAEYMV